MSVVRKYFKFYGQVQGVGFRFRAEKCASLCGINGWVKNNDDMSVEMEAQGFKEQIDKMIELIKKGNFIEIYKIEEKNIPLIDGEYGFIIKDY